MSSRSAPTIAPQKMWKLGMPLVGRKCTCQGRRKSQPFSGLPSSVVEVFGVDDDCCFITGVSPFHEVIHGLGFRV